MATTITTDKDKARAKAFEDSKTRARDARNFRSKHDNDSSLGEKVSDWWDKNIVNRSKKKEAKPRKRRQDKRRIDYRYAQDDPFLFIKGKSVWTGVILNTTSDDFTSYAKELSQANANVEPWRALSIHFANQYNDSRVQYHLVTRFVPLDVSRWRNQYVNNLWNPTELFKGLVDEKVVPHIAESTPERRQYLLIRLGDFNVKGRKDPISAVLGSTAAVTEEIFDQRDLAPFREKARGVQLLMEGHGATAMERADLAWLIRKALMGHYPVENGTGVARTRPWRGGYFDEIVNSGLEVFDNYVRIPNPNPNNGMGEYSYTTTLTINYISPVIRYNYSNAWGKKLRSMPRPVDVSWRGTIISAEEWKALSKPDIGRLEDEANERYKTGAAPSLAFDQKYEIADGLKQKNEIQAQPVLVSQQRITVSAPSPDELNSVVGELQGLFGDDATLERTKGVQGYLLEEQLPGDMTPPRVGPGGLGRNFLNKFTNGVDVDGERWTDLEALAFARLDSSPSVGDDVRTKAGRMQGWRGWPIGYTLSNGAVVHFDPIVQMTKDSGAGTIIIGSSGGGKTSLSLLLFFVESEAGVQCIAIDPKDDFQNFVYYLSFGDQVREEGFMEAAQDGSLGTPGSPFQPVLPEFWEETSMIHLGNGTPGMLDPWAITNDYNTGETAAREIVKLVFDERDQDALDQAFQAMRKRYAETGRIPRLAEMPSYLGEEIERLDRMEHEAEASKEAQAFLALRDAVAAMRRVQGALERAAYRQFGKLMFGHTPNAETFEIGRRRRVIITLIGLSIPDDKSSVEEWTEDQRDAAAALLSAIRQLKEVFSLSKDEYSPHLERKGTRPRLLFVDEAYFITAFKAGRSMLNVFLRQGRSRFFGVIFISQQAKDVNVLNDEKSDDDEAETNQFPTKFVFRQMGSSEARDAMKLLRSSLADEDGEAMSDLSSQLLRPEDGGQMETGVCVMSDADGRTSMLRVDRLFREIVAAAETNPGARSDAQSTPLSAVPSDWQIDNSTRDALRTGVIATEKGEVREALTRYEYDEFQYIVEDSE